MLFYWAARAALGKAGVGSIGGGRAHRTPSSGGIAKGSAYSGAGGQEPIGRPRLPKDLHGLIGKMAAGNPTWGEERIANELKLKLGIRVSPRRVQKYLVGGGCPGRTPDPSQGWLTFVHNHAQAILASDFLVVVTARFRVLYVLVIMELGSRRRSGGGFCRRSRRKRHQLAGSTDDASGTWVRKMGKTSLGGVANGRPAADRLLCQETVMDWPYEC